MLLRFQFISHLLALAILPVLIALFVWMLYWRRQKLKRLGDERLVMTQLRGFVPGRSTLKFTLQAIAITAIIVGWANLQAGDKMERVQRKGVDVVIALDVSKSMLAQDVQPDRLTRAKQLISLMLDKMQNDRVALIVFAGRAYQQVPLTVDYSALKMLLQTAGPNLVPTQGTVISDAIMLAEKSFSQKEKKYKSLIVISDGEDHDQQAVTKAKEASELGVIVHTIGVGSPQGSTLYDPATRSVKLDENGQPVVSKLNEPALRSIAMAGNGTYNLLQNTDAIATKLVNELDGMEQKSLGAVVFTDYTNYYQYFIAIGLVLLIIEWMIPGVNRKLKVKVS